MIQGWQRLCGVVLLAILTAGRAWGAEAVEIRLHRGTPLEERARDQLRRVLRTYDLRKWLFTRDVLIQSDVIPHSHQVLTLNTHYVDDDIAQLSTFVHEQDFGNDSCTIHRQHIPPKSCAKGCILNPVVPRWCNPLPIQ
jgi:hypothetical protein